MKARLWRFLHNVVVHPLMEVLPATWGDYLHEKTALKAFSPDKPSDTEEA